MAYINSDAITQINFNIEDYEELFTAYKQDLENYIQAFSGKRDGNIEYAKRYLLSRLEEKWLPLLNFNANRIMSDIRELQAPKVDVITSMTLRELLTYDDGDIVTGKQIGRAHV